MENFLYLTLEQLPPGSRGIVRRLEGGRGLSSRLAALGVVVGSRVEVLENRGHGPMLVLVRDTRVALGRSEALKIFVEQS
ncbi:MAG TPA: FeoA family protein [Candidatus Binatia bacterium]|jgi:ferrous iron transport protein A